MGPVGGAATTIDMNTYMGVEEWQTSRQEHHALLCCLVLRGSMLRSLCITSGL